MAVSVAGITRTLTDQHNRIKRLMETVVAQDGPQRQDAFSELCRFIAAHEAAEEECIHRPALKLDGDIALVDQRREEEDKAGEAIAELERIGTTSPDFPDKFDEFRRAVIASQAEAEKDEELPRLIGPFDDTELIRIQQALARVPALAARDAQDDATFLEHLQTARAEFRSGSPTAR